MVTAMSTSSRTELRTPTDVMEEKPSGSTMNGLQPCPPPITVALVSNNHLLRLGLQTAIKAAPHITLLTATTSAEKAEQLIAREKPQVIIIELTPEVDILELVRKVRSSVSTARVIVLSDIEDNLHVLQTLSSRIDGIVLNTQPAAVLLVTIDHVSRLPTETMVYQPSDTGRSKIDETVKIIGEAKPSFMKWPVTLTEREREIIALVGQGLSNKSIADRLSISDITVRHHLTSIFNKVGVSNRQKLLIQVHKDSSRGFTTVA